MPRFHYLDIIKRQAMFIAGNDEPLKRSFPIILDCLCHCRRGLARADDDGSALGRGRQESRQRRQRIGGTDRRLEQVVQKILGLLSHVTLPEKQPPV